MQCNYCIRTSSNHFARSAATNAALASPISALIVFASITSANSSACGASSPSKRLNQGPKAIPCKHTDAHMRASGCTHEHRRVHTCSSVLRRSCMGSPRACSRSHSACFCLLRSSRVIRLSDCIWFSTNPESCKTHCLTLCVLRGQRNRNGTCPRTEFGHSLTQMHPITVRGRWR